MPPDYRSISFWLETCGDDLAPRAPLDGSTTADVAILGAGFTGLWTAYELLRREPSLHIAILEAEIAGFGASGRNGGWCFSGFPVSPLRLLERYGYDAARAVSLAMIESVNIVGQVCQDEGIDAHYAKGENSKSPAPRTISPSSRRCTTSTGRLAWTITSPCSMPARRSSA